MITAQELHIEINQDFQKIASNIYDYFLPEEIDWCLNKHQDRFIEKCVRPRKDGSGAMEVIEAHADDIQNIIKSDIELITFRDNTDRAYSILPSDYRFLLNDRSKVLSDCSDSFTTNTSNYIEYIGKLKFNNSGNSLSPYYNIFSIVINGSTVFDISNYNISTGLNSVNEKFVIINLVLEVLNRNGYIVYWERYRDIYEADTFIFISTSNITGSIAVDNIITNIVTVPTTYQIFNSSSDIESSNRLIKTAAKHDVLNNNVFHKTIPKSPVTNLASNKLYVNYSEERFIVNKLIIDYVRKPQKISLILNQSCDLSENAVRKICDLTGEYLRMIVQSPTYQSKLQDNVIRME